MYNLKIKYYNNGTMQIIHFDNPVVREKRHKRYTSEAFEEEEQLIIDISEASEISKELREVNLNRSLRRSKQKIIDYCRNNTWELFVTFTLDGEKVDRYNFEEASKKLRKWLNNQLRNSPNAKYVIIPEFHKDGAIHFHGLLSGFKFKLEPALSPYNGKLLKDNKNRQIFNIKQYKLGFSTATIIDDTKKVTTYILKYVTKDLISMLPGKQKYYISKTCELPFETTYFVLPSDLDETLKKIQESNDAIITFQKELVVDTDAYKNNITYYELDGNQGVLLD